MLSNLAFVERIRHRTSTQRYQQLISNVLQREALLRVFPALQSLPLPLSYPDGRPCAIESALANRARILLCAEPGAGAQLALVQLAAQWSAQASTSLPLPFPIDIRAIDQAHASPIACLSELIWSHQELSGPTGRLQLLVSGWEDLPALRREAWRLALCGSLPERVAQIVVVVPLQERLWQGFAPIVVGRPDLALQARWASLLADQAVSVEQLAAQLRPGDRLIDALMQVLALRMGAAQGRAQAAEKGLALLQSEAAAFPQVPSHSAKHIGNDDLLARSSLSFGLQAMLVHEERLLHRARMLKQSGFMDGLLAFREHERYEMALLINSMLDNPQPLLRSLWAMRQNAPAVLHTLVRCLCESQGYSPAWPIQLCRTLAARIHEHPPEAAQLEHALTSCLPALDAALHILAQRPRPLRRLLAATMQALPDGVAQSRLAWLAYTEHVHPTLAWDAADALIARAAQGMQYATFAPEWAEALPRWAYVQCLSGPASRLRLLQSTERALAALSALPAVRRLRVARVLLGDAALPQIIRLAAFELLRGCNPAEVLTLLRSSSTDDSPMLRAAAMQALERQAPEQVQDLVFAKLADPATSESEQDEALQTLARLREKALPLAERLIANQQMRLYVRLKLVELTGRSRNGLEHLTRLLPRLQDSPIVTAAVLSALALRIAKPASLSSRRSLQWSSRRRHGPASLQWRTWLARRRQAKLPSDLLPQLLGLAQQEDAQNDVRVAACRCLGLIAGPDALACLTSVLHASKANLTLSLAVATALGATRDPAALPALASLLDGQAMLRLRESVPASMLREPSVRCVQAAALPRPIAQRLELHLAQALTEADKPSTLTEFLLSEAELLRVAAAKAIVRIGGQQASTVLAESLRRGSNASSTPLLALCLAACGAGGIAALETMLCDESLPMDLRLAAAQALAENRNAEELALWVLAKPRLGGMLRGALAIGLGKRRCAAAGPLLRLIIQDMHNEAYLRMQALQGLSYLSDVTSEALLLQIITNEAESEHIRGAAARALPAAMSAMARQKLLSLLYQDHLPAGVIVGGLEALGNAGEAEILPLTMRYGLDTRAAVVKAAIAAMTAIGNSSITPVLVRISQNPNADLMTRLSAIGSLLRFDAQEYFSLLNSYLYSGQVLIQIQALEHIIAAGVDSERIAGLIEQEDFVLALRQRVLTALSNDDAARPSVLAVLLNAGLPAALRTRAALALAQIGTAQELDTLAELASSPEEGLALRLACMQSLARLQPSRALHLFSHMLEQPDTAALIRFQAASLLLQSLQKIYRAGGHK